MVEHGQGGMGLELRRVACDAAEPPTPHPRTRSRHREHKRQIIGGDQVGIEGEHEGGKADVEEVAEL